MKVHRPTLKGSFTKIIILKLTCYLLFGRKKKKKWATFYFEKNVVSVNLVQCCLHSNVLQYNFFYDLKNKKSLKMERGWVNDDNFLIRVN